MRAFAPRDTLDEDEDDEDVTVEREGVEEGGDCAVAADEVATTTQADTMPGRKPESTRTPRAYCCRSCRRVRATRGDTDDDDDAGGDDNDDREDDDDDALDCTSLMI